MFSNPGKSARGQHFRLFQFIRRGLGAQNGKFSNFIDFWRRAGHPNHKENGNVFKSRNKCQRLTFSCLFSSSGRGSGPKMANSAISLISGDAQDTQTIGRMGWFSNPRKKCQGLTFLSFSVHPAGAHGQKCPTPCLGSLPIGHNHHHHHHHPTSRPAGYHHLHRLHN